MTAMTRRSYEFFSVLCSLKAFNLLELYVDKYISATHPELNYRYARIHRSLLLDAFDYLAPWLFAVLSTYPFKVVSWSVKSNSVFY